MTFPEPQNLTSIPAMFRYANKVSDNVFIPLMMLSLYIIVFLFLKQKQTTDIACAAAAGFLTVIATIILALLGLVEQKLILITLVAVIVPLILLYSFSR